MTGLSLEIANRRLIRPLAANFRLDAEDEAATRVLEIRSPAIERSWAPEPGEKTPRFSSTTREQRSTGPLIAGDITRDLFLLFYMTRASSRPYSTWRRFSEIRYEPINGDGEEDGGKRRWKKTVWASRRHFRRINDAERSRGSLVMHLSDFVSSGALLSIVCIAVRRVYNVYIHMYFEHTNINI